MPRPSRDGNVGIGEAGSGRLPAGWSDAGSIGLGEAIAQGRALPGSERLSQLRRACAAVLAEMSPSLICVPQRVQNMMLSSKPVVRSGGSMNVSFMIRLSNDSKGCQRPTPKLSWQRQSARFTAR